MFRGMKSTKLSGGGWSLDNASCVQSLDLSTIDSVRFALGNCDAITISRDGHSIYIAVADPNAIIQLDLAIAGDLDTVSLNYSEKATPDISANQKYMVLSPDKTVLMAVDASPNTADNYIYQYHFSEPGNIATLVFDKKYQYNTINLPDYTSILDFSPEGLRMFLNLRNSSDSNHYLRQYNLASPWDIGSVTFAGEIIAETFFAGIFDTEGKKMVYYSDMGLRIANFSSAFDVLSFVGIDPSRYTPCNMGIYGFATSPKNNNLYNLKSDSTITRVQLKTSNDFDRTAPVADAGSDQLDKELGTLIQLDGSQSYDTNIPPLGLYYNWSLTDKPDGSTAVLSSTTIVNPSFVLDVTGSYRPELIVSNGKQSSLPNSVEIRSVGSLVSARYWGIKNTTSDALRPCEIEFLLENNGKSVTEVDPSSIILGLASLGDVAIGLLTNGDLAAGVLMDLNQVIKFDVGSSQGVKFVRIANYYSTAAILKFRVLRSDDNVIWYESAEFAGYTQANSREYISGNYIDFSETTWTQI